jgi:UDP-N-acetylmuramyl pentapeptide phosphotransferase/UDP-N-acetylglucosamine-1-phosphate transferase
MSLAIVETVRRVLIARGMYDPITPRSSHTRPTPRMGGIGIVVVSAIGFAVIAARTPADDARRVWSLLAAFVLVAAVSLRDDLKPLSARMRFAVQVAAAVIVIVGCGYWRSVSFAGFTIPLGIAGVAVTAIWIVGVTNAFNFMDGIDGIAGGQAVVAAAGWALLARARGDETTFWLALIAGAAALGFLLENWPPARIFMGDVASASLGLFFASLPFVARGDSGSLAVPAALMLWPFLFDTAFTLVRRALRGENIAQAHRSHIYQRMVIGGRSHAAVSSLYIALAVAGAAAALWLAS